MVDGGICLRRVDVDLHEVLLLSPGICGPYR